MKVNMELSIRQAAFEDILRAAERARPLECVGLLATDGCGLAATAACLLPAQASPSHAEAEPLALRQAIDLLTPRGLVASGLWHNHGNHRVFHSATDDDTMLRLAPA